LKQFKLKYHDTLAFPDSLLFTRNYFNPSWRGLRRVKNVVMVLEVGSCSTGESLQPRPSDELRVELTPEQSEVLARAHTLLGFHAASEGNLHYLNMEDLRNAVEAATDTQPSDALISHVIQQLSIGDNCAANALISLEAFRKLVTSYALYPETSGRYWMAVSLAEAETIRRILHVRKKKNPSVLIPNSNTEVALRYSPIAAPDAPPAGDGGIVFDASWGWQRRGSGATPYEAAMAHSSFRFFDCDMHYSTASLNILIRSLIGSTRERERFFMSTIGTRRRLDRKVTLCADFP
jgi:hypothetical protein